MANLTKKVLGLAGTAMVFAGMSFGQNFNGCSLPAIANGGSPILDRFEGTTELVADIIISCPATALSNAAIKLQMSLPITSPVLDKAGNTDAVIRITDATTPANNQIIQGVGIAGTPTQMIFNGVNFPGDPFTITFSNIRVNASMAANGTSNIAVTESFFILNLGQEIYNQAPVSVGFVQTGFSTPVLTSKLAAQYVICTANPITGLQVSNIPLTNGTASFAINQQTLFGGALKTINPGTGYGGGPGPSLTNGEAGSFAATLANGDVVGAATHGTRIQFAFSGVNAGETIYLPNSIIATIPQNGGPPANDPNVVITLTTAPNGKPFAAYPAASILQAPSPLAGTVAFTGDANGNIVAVYEATIADSTKQNETFIIPGWIVAKPNFSSTSVGAVNLTVGLAPQAGTGVTDIPSFNNSYPSIALSPFNLCQTTLLFPFVSAGTAAAPGFDTGIAISNTGMDPYITGTGATGTPGVCTFNLYSTLSSSTPPTPAAVATSLAALNGSGYPANGIIPPGATVAFSLGNENIAPGFTGYIIAQCQFLYAHGFAYITYGGDSPVTVNSEMAMGYLAEVLQNNRSNPNGGAGPEGVTF